MRKYCAVTGVLQMHIPFERYTAILDTIASAGASTAGDACV